MEKVTVNRLKTKHTLIYQYINKIHAVLAVLFSLILLTSCEYFNRPMLNYLEEWTNTAQISKYTLDGDYPVTAGLSNVPSGEDRVITYYIINPQNYVLDSTVTFAHDKTLDVDNNTPADFAVVEQDLQDKNIIRLTLKNSVGATGIFSLDGDGIDISPTLTITEPNSGRKFNSYTVPFRINSAPAPVENPAILYDTTDNTYVICFNMPDINKSEDAPSIHRDIVSLSVSGDYAKNYTVTAPVNSSGNGLASGEGIINTYSHTWKPVAGGAAFIGNRDVRFAAIKTGINIASNKNPRCTLTLTDSSGLTATATATTEVQPLSAVVGADKASGSVLKENDSVTFRYPVHGVKVHITCSPMKGVQHNGVDLSGSVTGDGAVTLTFTTAGTYTVTAYATMDGAGDSDPVTFTYAVKGKSGGGVLPPPDLTNYTIKAMKGNIELTKTGSYFVLDAGNPEVTFSLADKNGAEISDNTIQWKLSVDGTFVGQNSTGSNYKFTFTDAGYPTDTYVLTVYAYVSGYLYSESFTVSKISSGSSVIDKPITINRPVTIAPGTGENVIITAGVDQPIFNITGGGELTLGGGGGTVTIDGGEISAPNGSSSLITVGTDGTLNITTGATIQNNRLSAGNGGGIMVNGGTVEMSGGTIINCQGENFGGGVYITSGTFTMSGGTIDNCFATYQTNDTRGGGGVTVSGAGTFNMSGNATIQNCRARMGGGVYVDGGTFNMSGGTIQNNTAEGTQINGLWGGGGVFVTGTGSFTLTGGTISNNNVSGTSATGGAISINGTPTFKCEVDKIGTGIIIENNKHISAQDQINMITGVKLAITENGSAKTLSSRIQIREAADVKSGLTDAYNSATP
ncbi:MAG: hypothetical protein PUI38_05555 [Candidatus Treponema excrementipullorum]|nr:hypothetical protein [Spirochaetia bacterium]MDD7012305.1 hypothetical protein [Candidatus Treponema excrementipullorum]